MKLDERLAHHRRMAEGYRNAYLHQAVQEGEEGHTEYVDALRRRLEQAGVA